MSGEGPMWRSESIAWRDALALLRQADNAGTEMAAFCAPDLPGRVATVESGGCVPNAAPRWQLVGLRPLASLEQPAEGIARLCLGDQTVTVAASGWDLLQRAARQLLPVEAVPFALSPGWMGFIAFEAADQILPVGFRRAASSRLPALRLTLFTDYLLLDLQARSARRITVADPARVSERLARLAHASRFDQPSVGKPRPGRAAADCDATRAEFEAMVVRALEYIRAGDIYQVNLSRRISLGELPPPGPIFEQLAGEGAIPYPALFKWGGQALLSASPELMLKVHGRTLLTSPIKGTRPRGSGPQADERNCRELIESGKEAAELAMMVDLHRNDLGRVSDYGSVRVRRDRYIQEHPTLFHAVADIEGHLRADCTAMDALAACFPAGSVSGAPKIRALRIIDELELAARGAYTGAIGVLGLDGDAVWSVAIRVLQMSGNRGELHVGGAVVAESDPAREYEETVVKSRGLLAAIDAARRGGAARRE